MVSTRRTGVSVGEVSVSYTRPIVVTVGDIGFRLVVTRKPTRVKGGVKDTTTCHSPVGPLRPPILHSLHLPFPRKFRNDNGCQTVLSRHRSPSNLRPTFFYSVLQFRFLHPLLDCH